MSMNPKLILITVLLVLAAIIFLLLPDAAANKESDSGTIKPSTSKNLQSKS
jgi:hypothetical protein